MKISVEISMYPLTESYIEPIKSFIEALHSFSDIEIRTNGMSTQIFGEYASVLSALTQSMEPQMADRKVVFVTKFLGTDVSEYK